MDLGELLGGGGGGNDLNADLAATTPAGESVFSKPFGAATAYRTAKGAVRVAFVFDPYATYGELAILASTNPDYMDVVREELTKYLLKPEELAPRKSTLQEVEWESIKKNLGPDVLSRCVFSNEAKLKEYTDLVKKRAAAVFGEDELLYQKISQDTFSFCLKIAIDAFYNKNVPSTSVDGKGILTIRIDGGSAALSSIRHIPTASTAETPATDDHASKPKKKAGGGGGAGAAGGPNETTKKEDLSKLAQIIDQLNMTESEKSHMVHEKAFPDSTDEFFDDITKWFSTVLSTRTKKLDAESSQIPLYQ